MPRYDFRTPRLYVDAPLAAGGEVALDRDQAQLPAQRAAAQARRRVLLFNGRDGEWQAQPRRRGQEGADRRGSASATREQPRAGRPAFSVRAAQACPARLSGAEGGGDGRLAPAAGDHPAHPGGAGQSRAHARQCRSRPPSSAASWRAGGGRAGGLRPRCCRRRDAGRLLVFCDEDAEVQDPSRRLPRRVRRQALLPASGGAACRWRC